LLATAVGATLATGALQAVASGSRFGCAAQGRRRVRHSPGVDLLYAAIAGIFLTGAGVRLRRRVTA